MLQQRLRTTLTLAIATVLAIGTAIAVAPAAAAGDDYCAGAGRYLLLVDPTGAADQALCHVQESALQQLNEQQWGEPYTPDQRSRMLSWGRQDSLAAMYLELLRIASKQASARTPDEATVYAWLQTTLGALRNQMAEAAYSEQIAFKNDPCGYVPPGPGSSTIPCGNSGSLLTLFGPPPGPTYEQFVNYGAQRALSQNFGATQLATIGAMARSARDQLIGAAVGVVGGIGIGVGMVAAATAGLAYSAMLVSMGAITASTTAATAAVSAVGAFIVSAAASVAFVALAVTLAVVRGVQVFEEAAIPGKLRDDIAAAKQPVDIESWVGSDSSRATLLLQAIARRINTAPAPTAPVPSTPAPDAQGFLVTGAVDDTTYTQELRFRSPTDATSFFTAWMDHGWWVIQDDAGNRALTHTLVYVDHAGKTRSASWMTGIDGVAGDRGFLVTTSGISAPSTTCTDNGCVTTGCTEDGGCASTQCTSANGCETTDALEIVTGPAADATGVARGVTATVHTDGVVFSSLPDIASNYDVGADLRASISAAASYLTTMSYRWDLTRRDQSGDQTTSVDGNSLDKTLTIAGDYHLQVTATASSNESVTQGWDFVVTGQTQGQLVNGVLLTQYPTNVTEPVGDQGPWLEGSDAGTICLSMETDEATTYKLQFEGENVEEQNSTNHACFSRPDSAKRAGIFRLASVYACPTVHTEQPCPITTGLTYDDGNWVQHSLFTYAVTNEPPTAGIDGQVSGVEIGAAAGDLTLSSGADPVDFTVGDTVRARTVVSDAGGGQLTVHVRWSDGTEEVLPDQAESGSTIDVTHTYGSVAWGPVGVQIWAVDDTGATGALATGWFVVHPRPATLALHAAPVVGDDGLVTLTGTITDPDGTASLLGVDWGDGTSDGSGDGTGYVYEAPFPAPVGTETSTAAVDGTFQVSHRYTVGGTHTIQAYVWNSAEGAIPITSTDVKVPKTAYSVASDGPITVTPDSETHTSTVSLDALLGNLGDDQLDVDVDFGDGSSPGSITGKTPGDTVPITHQFADGQHTITITVTDGDGATSHITRCFVLTEDVITPCTNNLPATDEDVRANPSGPVDAPESAQRGAQITISLGEDHAGESVTLYLYSTPTLLGTFPTDASGDVAVTVPASIPAGSHTVAAFVGAALVGWAPVTVVSEAGPVGGGSGDGAGSSSGAETGSEGGTDTPGEDADEIDEGGHATDGGGAAAEPASHHTAQADRNHSAGNASDTATLAQTGVRTLDLLALALLLLVVGSALTISTRRQVAR